MRRTFPMRALHRLFPADCSWLPCRERCRQAHGQKNPAAGQSRAHLSAEVQLPARNLTVIARVISPPYWQRQFENNRRGVQVSMSDIRAYFPGRAVQLSQKSDPEGEPSALPSNKVPAERESRNRNTLQHPRAAPKINIPKELFVALFRFHKTRKSPG